MAVPQHLAGEFRDHSESLQTQDDATSQCIFHFEAYRRSTLQSAYQKAQFQGVTAQSSNVIGRINAGCINTTLLPDEIGGVLTQFRVMGFYTWAGAQEDFFR